MPRVASAWKASAGRGFRALVATASPSAGAFRGAFQARCEAREVMGTAGPKARTKTGQRVFWLANEEALARAQKNPVSVKKEWIVVGL